MCLLHSPLALHVLIVVVQSEEGRFRGLAVVAFEAERAAALAVDRPLFLDKQKVRCLFCCPRVRHLHTSVG